MSPEEILHKYWGYSSFRPFQREIIDEVLNDKDTLALLPTGGGKSICYQVPGLIRDGLCLVVSPLIALMKDQVANLQKRGIKAVAIYSGMHRNEIDRILDNCIYGKIRFLYLSPERLSTRLFEARVTKMNISLIAVDEAHCISQWGYDFRPAYMEIAKLRTIHPNTPILALTASATPQVEEDIQNKLEFRSPNLIRAPFLRPNLSFSVLTEEGKRSKMLEILKKVSGSAIVYARTRRQTVETAHFLKQQRIRADFYHGGLNQEERTKRQEAWINNQIRVIAATNAFGMGIDKPDVRTVIHLHLPDNLEAYYQEAGRAGRDGKRAYAVLLYNENDRMALERQVDSAFPEITAIKRVYTAIGNYLQLAVGSGADSTHDFDIGDFATTFNLNPVQVFNCLKILEQAGWLLLTDAVFHPASIMIKVGKEDLYAYQIKNRGSDQLIQTILRTYQGAFTSHVKIYERRLASFLHQSHKQVAQRLTAMHQEGIIDYIPQKNKPQLVLLKERVPVENLLIDNGLLQFRKQRYLEHIQKAIGYANAGICRSQYLLQYFGEENPQPCGICDICLGRTKSNIPTNEHQKFSNRIKSLLLEKPRTLHQVIQAFSLMEEEKVLKTLEYLIENGFIHRSTDENLTWRN